MKEKILFIGFLIFFSISVQAQRACTDIPTTAELTDLLKNKPVPEDFSHLLLNKKCNITNAVKQRLLYLTGWQWTNEEIDKYVAKNLSENYDWFDIDKEAAKTAKGNDSLFKKNRDSLILIWQSYIHRHMAEEGLFIVPREVILSVAYLDYKESVARLLKAQTDAAHYDTATVTLALARLGNQTSVRSVIAKNRYDKSVNGEEWMRVNMESAAKLRFIASQESLYELHNWMDPSKTYAAMGDGNDKTKCCALIISGLALIIQNKDFQSLVANMKENPWSADDKLVLSCKNWLITNKGRYIINREAAY